MKRVLLSVGCNSYKFLPCLNFAEIDADSVYKELISAGSSEYDSHEILRSPSLIEVRVQLTKLLFSDCVPDVFTFFFAGHGQFQAGSFHLCLSDSRSHALSATALSLSEVLRMVAEAKIPQTHIVIDACYSGSLVSDLTSVLDSSVLRGAGTPGITLLATAAADQVAYEADGNGVGTRYLLKYITGEFKLNDSAKALDLIEIGRDMSIRMSKGEHQTPVVWGLNLYGPPSFCKNPHADFGDQPLRSIMTGWPNVEITSELRDRIEGLWLPYVNVVDQWDSRQLTDCVGNNLSIISTNPNAIASFASRIIAAFVGRAMSSPDPFRPVEVRAACLVSLLPYSSYDTVSDLIETECSLLSQMILDVMNELNSALSSEWDSLLGRSLSDLYYLPMRIARIIGWFSFAVFERDATNSLTSDEISTFSQSINLMHEHYSGSIRAVCDEQGPYLITLVCACERVGLFELARQHLDHYMASAASVGGRIAQSGLPASSVLTYLIAIHLELPKVKGDVYARPCELVLALMRLSVRLGIEDVMDKCLEDFDRLSVGSFIVSDFHSFGDEVINSGNNIIFKIGYDVWTVRDVEEKWPTVPSPENLGVKLASILACLLFPDRAPWFLLESIEAAQAR